MEKDWISLLKQQKAIAVIRVAEVEAGVEMAKAVAAGGMRLIEITWNSSQPAKLIHQLRAELPTCLIGAGTLLTLDDVQTAIDTGADFLFTPHTQPSLIQAALQQQIPIVPGALTPSEILAAWQAGASCVKVFPIQAVGGADYLRHLQAPLGEIPLIPTGGVTLANARSLIDAGAVAVGLGGELFPKPAIANQDWGQIRQRAMQLRQALDA